MMNHLKPKNRQKQTAFLFLGLSILFLILIFIPGITGMDGMNGGFAFSFISFFLSISFMFTSIIFFVLAKKFSSSINKQGPVLHWVYEKSDWLKFAQKEFMVQKKEKLALYIFIISISFVVLLILSIVLRDSWIIMVIVFFGIAAILGFVAFIVPKIQYAGYKKNVFEVYISTGSAYITGEFYCWNILGAALEKVEMAPKGNQINITYSYPVRYHRSQTTLRIPVPNNECAKSEAEAAISLLKKSNNL